MSVTEIDADVVVERTIAGDSTVIVLVYRTTRTCDGLTTTEARELIDTIDRHYPYQGDRR